MSALPKPKYTLEEYLELDHRSEERLEFWDGEIYAMSGGSLRHDDIIINLISLLKNRLPNGHRCRVSGTEARMKAPASPSPYHYADASVTCGDREVELLGKQELLANPVLIIEVLSPTSEAFDRGDKFTFYKSIQSFREYLLVAQHRPHVTHFFKTDAGEWKYEEFNDLADTFELMTVGISLTLNEIYQGISFGR